MIVQKQLFAQVSAPPRIQAVQARYNNPGQRLDSWIMYRSQRDRDMLEEMAAQGQSQNDN